MPDIADQNSEELKAQTNSETTVEKETDGSPFKLFTEENTSVSDALGEAAKAARLAEESEAAAKEKEAKKSTRAKAKKAPDLKKPLPKLEPKDPSEVPMKWYFLQAFSGYEFRVAQALQERIKIHNMQDYFGEILVPKEKVQEKKEGRTRESDRKFFPGYVMVQMKMTSDSWQLVKHTERVLGFIGGTQERPLPISEAEAARILDRLRETSEAPRPKTLFEVGETVRATDGAFKDFIGTVEKVDYEKSRLTVSIAIFGRATPVDLEFSQVEKDV